MIQLYVSILVPATHTAFISDLTYKRNYTNNCSLITWKNNIDNGYCIITHEIELWSSDVTRLFIGSKTSYSSCEISAMCIRIRTTTYNGNIQRQASQVSDCKNFTISPIPTIPVLTTSITSSPTFRIILTTESGNKSKTL